MGSNFPRRKQDARTDGVADNDGDSETRAKNPQKVPLRAGAGTFNLRYGSVHFFWGDKGPLGGGLVITSSPRCVN